MITLHKIQFCTNCLYLWRSCFCNSENIMNRCFLRSSFRIPSHLSHNRLSRDIDVIRFRSYDTMSFSHPQYKSMRACHCITAGGGQSDQWTLLTVGGRSSRASSDPNISVIFNFHAIFCWFVSRPPPALLSWPRELSIRASLCRGCDTHHSCSLLGCLPQFSCGRTNLSPGQ